MTSVKYDQEEGVLLTKEISNSNMEENEKQTSFSAIKNEIGSWLRISIPKFINIDNENIIDNQDKPATSVKSETDISPKKDSMSDFAGNTFTSFQNRALSNATTLGSFLYSALNKAGKTVQEATVMVKESIEKNNILTKFNQEQAAFIKSQNENVSSYLPPWVGQTNEKILKDECLSLSTDRRHFTSSPPTGIDFYFNYQISYPIAMALMKEDRNLEMMRYELVPKVISEENFWKNYFYRISLICRASSAFFMPKEKNSQYIIESESENVNTDTYELVTEIDDVKDLNVEIKTDLSNSENEWVNDFEVELHNDETINEQKFKNLNINLETEIEELLYDTK